MILICNGAIIKTTRKILVAGESSHQRGKSCSIHASVANLKNQTASVDGWPKVFDRLTNIRIRPITRAKVPISDYENTCARFGAAKRLWDLLRITH